MRIRLFLLIGITLIFPLVAKQAQYNLSICAIFKNEAKHLKEWIEFHRLVGVDHFFLYNIESTDRYMTVLKPYIKERIVTLISWPDISKNQSDEIWSLGTQIPAYENAVKFAAAGKTKWLVFVDINEFLLPIDANNLDEIVEKYKDSPGILLSRTLFDASTSLPNRNLVLESIEMTAAPELNPKRTIENMIFKPELCSGFTWPPYHFIFKDGREPVKLNKWEMRINRYINRDQGIGNPKRFTGSIQMDHGRFEQEIDGLLQAGYEVEDSSIERFLPNLRKKMER